jgi:hypothetical protein
MSPFPVETPEAFAARFSARLPVCFSSMSLTPMFLQPLSMQSSVTNACSQQPPCLEAFFHFFLGDTGCHPPFVQRLFLRRNGSSCSYSLSRCCEMNMVRHATVYLCPATSYYVLSMPRGFQRDQTEASHLECGRWGSILFGMERPNLGLSMSCYTLLHSRMSLTTDSRNILRDL